APPPPTPPRKRGARPPGRLRTFSGSYFEIDYPAKWSIVDAEKQVTDYLDTTIEPPGDSEHVIRVDVTPGPGHADLAAAVEPLREAEHANRGYHELDFSPTTYRGYPAQRWEFLTDYQGATLHEVDTFFTADGNRYGVLVGVPAEEWHRWEPVFKQ